MNKNKIEKIIIKAKETFLEQTDENRKMLDVYFKYVDGDVDEKDLVEANKQFRQVLRSLGLGVLVILPFSPITIPYVIKKAKELGIDIIPDWYKKL
jgi:hypothetical protein